MSLLYSKPFSGFRSHSGRKSSKAPAIWPCRPSSLISSLPLSPLHSAPATKARPGPLCFLLPLSPWTEGVGFANKNEILECGASCEFLRIHRKARPHRGLTPDPAVRPDGLADPPLPLLAYELPNTDTHAQGFHHHCLPLPSLCVTQVLSKCFLGKVMMLLPHKETALFRPPLIDTDSIHTYASYSYLVLWTPALGFLPLGQSGLRSQSKGV